MNKLNRDITLFLINKGYHISQVGGTRRKYELIYNGHKIYYDTYKDGDTIVYYGGREVRDRPCFSLHIIGKLAILESIERGADCFIDKHESSKDVVLSAFQIAKNKGCKTFELVDNSYKVCYDTRFNLSDVYFLTHGQTWYESILPIKIKSKDESTLSEYRQKALTTKWQTISNYLLALKENIDVDLIGIDILAPGSAMKVLKRIKSMKNEISCKFFAKNVENILKASDIKSFHDTVWTVLL